MFPEKQKVISINNKIVEYTKDWFFNYVQTFKDGDKELKQNVVLKEEHTKRVCKEIVGIGKQLGLNDNDLRLAEIIALLHDVGRFEQYSRMLFRHCTQLNQGNI